MLGVKKTWLRGQIEEQSQVQQQWLTQSVAKETYNKNNSNHHKSLAPHSKQEFSKRKAVHLNFGNRAVKMKQQRNIKKFQKFQRRSYLWMKMRNRKSRLKGGERWPAKAQVDLFQTYKAIERLKRE